MSSSPSSERLYAYRPALDGLRALAVVAVLLYHGEVRWARGGFLGVDLFFVLSGYLITTLLLREWENAGRIALDRFWSGRARRLLPALFLMMVAVAAYGALLAPAGTLHRLRWDGLATLGYVANWRFVASHASYFELFLDPSPLTHMWSLGIEEQFYVVWPLVLLGALRLCRGRLRPILVGVVLLAAASALEMAALYQPGKDPSRVYYGTDTRAQALLIGVALALVLARRTEEGRVTRAATGPLGLVGLLGLVVMMVTVSDSAGWMYRGGFALGATAAALAVAATVAPGDGGLVRRVMALPPLPAIGRISYGLYLWHWPLYVALSPDRTHLRGIELLVLRIAVTFVVALLSYWLVEQPIRRGALTRRALARPVTTGAAAAVASVLVFATIGPPAAVASAPLGISGPGAPLGQVGKPVGVASNAANQAQPRAVTGFRIYLVGDSVAYRLATNFQPSAVPGAELGSDAIVGCGVARGRNIYGTVEQPADPACEQWPQRWTAGVATKPDVSLLVIGAWEIYDKDVNGQILRAGTADYEHYLDSELQLAFDILHKDGRPVAMVNVPCYHQPETTGAAGEAGPRNDPARVAWLNGVFSRFAATHRDGLTLLDLNSFLCPGGRYVDKKDGVQMRDDGVHFTPEGADLTWRWLDPQLRRLAAR
jgi:peptidoglycan/LPS O-acetylase OafA/YrhL